MIIKRSIVIFHYFSIILANYQIQSIILPPFHWNQTTFRSIPDGTLNFQVRLGDVMDLICPFYDEKQSYLIDELEQYNVYRVNSNEFERCDLDQLHIDPQTRLVITCNSPYDLMKYTLNFRSYLPIPNGLEFRSNQTYYFLSTSSHRDRSCRRLKIFVHDHHRFPSLTRTDSSVSEDELDSAAFNHNHKTSINKTIDLNDFHRPILHTLKSQRQSDSNSLSKMIRPSLQSTNESKSTETNLSASILLNFGLRSSFDGLMFSWFTLVVLVYFD